MMHEYGSSFEEDSQKPPMPKFSSYNSTTPGEEVTSVGPVSVVMCSIIFYSNNVVTRISIAQLCALTNEF